MILKLLAEIMPWIINILIITGVMLAIAGVIFLIGFLIGLIISRNKHHSK